MKTSPYKTVSSRTAWSCPWYHIRQDEIITPDGRSGEYNTIMKGEAVWIVPVTKAGEIILIHNYRYTIDDWCWEIPAGSREPGQSLKDTAVAELREEVGGKAEAWHYIGRSYTANGICDEVGHFYLATGVTLGKTKRESTEVLDIHSLPIAKVLHMVRAGTISDGPSALAIFMAEEKLKNLTY
jgi:ADP-ribose pyrophosphatase